MERLPMETRVLVVKAHFHLNGFVNKQNCRIWGSENPRIIHEKQMYPQRVTVRCRLWSRGLIGPYCFEEATGNTVTVSGKRYRAMISDFLWPRLEELEMGMDLNMDTLWLQQDRATCHISRETIALLRETFPDRLISLRGDQCWPPRFAT